MSETGKTHVPPQATPRRWEQKTYELLSFQLTTEFVAVFAEIAADGFTDLFSTPIQALGLARVTTAFFEWSTGPNSRPQQYQAARAENVPVGLRLADGYWEIVQQSDNFAGIAGIYADISTATGELDRGKYKNLRCEQG